jgi:CHRD domain
MRFRRLAVVVAGGLVAVAVAAPLLDSAPVRGPFFATLRGASEVPAGDPDGRGSFTAILHGRRLCFGMTVAHIGTPIAAHIHRGRAGVAGPIVEPLRRPARGGLGTSSGCTVITQALADQIRATPGRYYVNVHTGAYPGGAVRGQLRR